MKMKSRTKYLSVAAAAMLCGAAFAETAGDPLIAFSTVADTYANGDSVADGEWYALCQTTNTTFGGFKIVDGKVEAAREGEKIRILANKASGGRCPTIYFQLDATKNNLGNFFVYFLDTRDASGAPAATEAEIAASLNGWTVAVDGKGNPITVDTRSTTSAEARTTNSNAFEIDTTGDFQPHVVSINPADDRVEIVVANMNPAVRYAVKSGAKPSEVTTQAIEIYENDAISTGTLNKENVTFSLKADDARFFKIERASN
jgi:hypothetical protein